MINRYKAPNILIYYIAMNMKILSKVERVILNDKYEMDVHFHIIIRYSLVKVDNVRYSDHFYESYEESLIE